MKKVTKFIGILLTLMLVMGLFSAVPVVSAEEPLTTYTCDFEDNYIANGMIADHLSLNPRCSRGEILTDGDSKVLNFYVDNKVEQSRFEIFNSESGKCVIANGTSYTVSIKYKVLNISKASLDNSKTTIELIRYDGTSEGNLLATFPNCSFTTDYVSDGWEESTVFFTADLSSVSENNTLAIRVKSPTASDKVTDKEVLITTIYFDDIVVKACEDGARAVSFETNGADSIAPIVAAPGTEITLPSPTRNAYDFKGWYREASFKTAYTDSVMPSGNVKLYAKWEPAANAVVIDFMGASDVSAIAGFAGEKVTLPKPSKENYRFIGWYDSQGKRYEQSTVFPSESIKLSAKFEPVTTVVNFENHDIYDAQTDSTKSLRYRVVTEQSNYGPHSLKYDTEAGWNPGNFKGEAACALFDSQGNRIRIENGKTYTVSYYVKIASVNADKIYKSYRDQKDTYGLITLVTTQVSGSWVNRADQPYFDRYTPSDVTNEWKKVTRTFTATTVDGESNYLALAISGWSVIYIDDFKMWEGEAEAVEDGYSLSFETNGGNWIDTVYGKTNEEITLPDDPVREGYKFLGWYSDVTMETPFAITKFADDNITVYAAWEFVPVTDEPDDNSGNNLQGAIDSIVDDVFDENGAGPVVIIVLVAVALAIVTVVVVLIVMKKKKTKKTAEETKE